MSVRIHSSEKYGENKAKIRTSEYRHVGQGVATVHRVRPCSLHAFMPRVAQRDRRGASDEVVCVLAGAFGFESVDDYYGRANEATLSRLRAQARRARALAKVDTFVSRHGLAFSPPSSPPISPPTISEQQEQVDYGRANEATLSRLRAQAYRLDNCLAAMKASLKDKRSALAALDSEIDE